MSMRRNIYSTAVGAAFLAATLPLAAQAGPAEEAIAKASQLGPVEAGAALAATVLGEKLPPELQLELVKFLRDTLEDPENPDGPGADLETFTEALIQATLNTALNGVTLPDLPALGITLPIAPGQVPTIKQVFDTYGVAKTASFLVASLVVPDAAPILLPGNVRALDPYLATSTQTVTTGSPFTPIITTNVAVGRFFTTTVTLDIDTLISVALDNPTVTDLIAIQAPLSTSLALTVTCTQVTPAFLGRRCINFTTTTTTTQNSKVLATNPNFTFAYPVNAGQFPTRLTAQDAFQTVYDALGSLHTQKARDPLVTSPFAGLPGFQPLVPGTGLADLSTQAPPVNYFGLSTPAGSVASALSQGLVTPLLTRLDQGEIRLRERPATPYEATLNVGGLLANVTSTELTLGVTAGYRASEVRAGQISTMVVRWHNIGVATVGETVDNLVGALNLDGPNSLLTGIGSGLASTDATIYYDVPAGEYSLTNNRVDAQGAVFKTDWRVAAPGYNVPVPPTLPDAAGLTGAVTGLVGILGLPPAP